MDKFYTNDRLARLLFSEKSPLKILNNPFSFALISALLMAVFYIFAALVSGTLTTEADTDRVVLFKDWVAWFWIIILNPIVIGYYPWLSTKNIVEYFLNYLVKNNVMTKSDKDDLDMGKEINIYKAQKDLLDFIVFVVTFAYSITFF